MSTSLVDIFKKANVVLQIVILTLRIDLLELGLDKFAFGFAASEEVDTWFTRLLDEVPERCLPDAACSPHEDGN